jgi:hypothetical protein
LDSESDSNGEEIIIGTNSSGDDIEVIAEQLIGKDEVEKLKPLPKR